MSELYLPDFSEILAVSHSRGAESEAPYLWDDLAAFYPIAAGGGSTAWDVSGFGRNGVLVNGPTWGVGERGTHLEFDGTSSRNVNLGDIDAPVTALSISTWIRPDFAPGAAQSRHVFDKAGDDNLAAWRLFYRDVDQDFRFRLFTTSGVRNVNNGETWSANEWHHLAATYDGASMKMYWDGNFSNSTDHTGAITTNNVDLLIGFSSGSLANSSWLGGLANLVFHSRALVLSEIQQLHQDPDAMLRLRSKPHPTAVAAAAGNRRRRMILLGAGA